jgi:pimeloyl-ACP methyl ester carboxylesterase/DNA-binding winged helix-turn-helix (wHTH) protein
MILRFEEFEIDTALREVRRGGVTRALQPKPFAVLEYLAFNRERVVPKEELLEALWPGVVVSEGSIQRAVSLARAAIDDDGNRIRTIPRQGYRFMGRVDETGPSVPPSVPFRPRFVVSGDAHIAYHVLGEGEVDIVLITGWVFPMRAFFDHPEIEELIRSLSTLGRVVLFDKRGTGLSDRVRQLPPLQQRIDDLRAVLDAVGSRTAVLVGISEGGPLSLFAAASMPERVRGLLMVGSYARWPAAPDYPPGWLPERFERLHRYIRHGWGAGETILAIAESRSGDPAVAAWAARTEQEGASPGAALDLLEMNREVDVRAILPAVAVPTVVVHGKRDALFPIENARYLADRIPGAELVEVDSRDHALLFEGSGELREALRGLLQRPARGAASFLATVLVVEGETGDESALRDLASRHGGVPAGEGLAWSFDGPQRAVRCAHVLLASPPAGARARAGIHAGEVVRHGGRLEGDGVDTARLIARAASPGRVNVSRVVRDLIPASAFEFETGGSLRLDDGRSIAVLLAEPLARNRKTVRPRRGR